MLRITVAGTTYTVHFLHGFESRGKKPRRITRCRMHPGECVGTPCEINIESIAVCSRKDKFHGKEGEKAAFAKAIAAFPRQQRAMFWGQSGLDKRFKKVNNA